MFKQAFLFTRPAQARQDVPFPGAAAASEEATRTLGGTLSF